MRFRPASICVMETTGRGRWDEVPLLQLFPLAGEDDFDIMAGAAAKLDASRSAHRPLIWQWAPAELRTSITVLDTAEDQLEFALNVDCTDGDPVDHVSVDVRVSCDCGAGTPIHTAWSDPLFLTELVDCQPMALGTAFSISAGSLGSRLKEPGTPAFWRSRARMSKRCATR